MKILFCGGGTSGHVHPAIAISDAIKKIDKKAIFLFIGREGGFENRAITRKKITLKTLKIEGLQRSLTLKNIEKINLAAKAYKKAVEIIKDFAPDVIVGTGGYVSWPVIKAAQKMKIPTVLHESNASPGLTAKLLAPKCDLVLLNHEITSKKLKKVKNFKVVGNPLRLEFSALKRNRIRQEIGISDNEIFILSFGGSVGSEKLNRVIINLMKKHVSVTKNIHHLHATGKKYYEEYNKVQFENENRNCKILPYIDDMPRMLSAADIVISRSGAITLSELATVGIAAILIPSPNVTDNHQYKNAKLLSDASACIMIEEKNLTEDVLYAKLMLLINDPEARLTIAEKIKKFAIPNASQKAAAEIVDLCRK